MHPSRKPDAARQPEAEMSSQSNPQELEAVTFPENGTLQEKPSYLIRYAVCAPSELNSQPWIFRCRGERIDLYADESRSLSRLDPSRRSMYVSCGAALFQLRMAMHHFGLEDTVTLFPDPSAPNWLAR